MSDDPSTTDIVDRIVRAWGRERGDLDPSPLAVFGRIRRLAWREQQALLGVLPEFGLTPPMYRDLAALRRMGQPFCATSSELAAQVMLTSGGMTNSLDNLEARGFVTRVQSDADRRVWRVQLTQRGREVVDAAVEAVLREQAAMLVWLTPGERATLSALLARVERTAEATADAAGHYSQPATSAACGSTVADVSQANVPQAASTLVWPPQPR